MVWLGAGLLTGLTSFGSNLVAVPFISLVFPARDSILIGCVAATLIFFGLAILYRRGIIWRDAFLLVCGAFAGMPLGIWFLKNSGSRALLLAAGAALVLFLLWQAGARHLVRGKNPVNILWALPLGLASGVMMGSVGMGGPPLVLYIFLRKYGREETISTINAASAGIMLGVLPWQYLSGLFPAHILKLGILGGVFGILGIIASIPLAQRLNLGLFRRLLLGTLALSAIVLLWRGLN